MMEIVHLSDPHFGAINGAVPEILIQHLRRRPADLIILTGDITQRARPSQFAAAQDFIARLLPQRVVVTPGNHDIPLFHIFLRLLNPYRDFQRYLQQDLLTVEGFQNVGLVVINSSRWSRQIQGEIRINELARALEAIDGAKFKLVAFHHPMSCRDGIDRPNLLINRDLVEKTLNEHQVDLVIGGHIHDPFVTVLNGKLVVAVSGTCASYRIRAGAPNSFNRYKILEDGQRLVAERYDLKSQGDFDLVSSSEFSKSDFGWRPVSALD